MVGFLRSADRYRLTRSSGPAWAWTGDALQYDERRRIRDARRERPADTGRGKEAFERGHWPLVADFIFMISGDFDFQHFAVWPHNNSKGTYCNKIATRVLEKRKFLEYDLRRYFLTTLLLDYRPVA
jgi:hypothetical protein